jgi:TonB family protein
MEVLIEKRAELDSKDDGSSTPLMWAISNNRPAAAELLVGRGADVNIRQKGGSTPLILAAANDNQLILSLLLDKGADVNARNDEGRTSLLAAAAGGHTEIVKLLLARNVEVHSKDKLGNTALRLAVVKDATATVELLLGRNADVNVPNNEGETPLMAASSVKMVDLLLGSGAAINATNQYGETAFTFAGFRSKKEVAEYLTSKGATGPVGVTEMPRLIRAVEPEYTEVARQAKLQGTVILRVVVNTEGRATNIRVAKSLGYGLDEQAIRAVQKWQFRPSARNGRVADFEATIEVNFRLL